MGELAQGNDGITEDAGVAARALTLDRVCGIRLTGVEMGQESGGEVSAGGRADDVMRSGSIFPLGGTSADSAQSAGSVLRP